jgi:hypothetical protein
MPGLCTVPKNNRFQSEATYRRHPMLCHDVAVQGASWGSRTKTWTRILSTFSLAASSTIRSPPRRGRASPRILSGFGLTFLGRATGISPEDSRVLVKHGVKGQPLTNIRLQDSCQSEGIDACNCTDRMCSAGPQRRVCRHGRSGRSRSAPE